MISRDISSDHNSNSGIWGSLLKKQTKTRFAMYQTSIQFQRTNSVV